MALDPLAYQAASGWLIHNGFSYDQDINADVNGDGVSLLMAYALDLDPAQNLAGQMPIPILGANDLSMDYFAVADGITYEVQASDDLVDWETIPVTYSGLNISSRRTAMVDRTGHDQLYLRLNVSE